MGVPLGHKNYRNSRDTFLDITERYSNKKKYKIVNNTAVLSPDGKRFIMLAPDTYDTYKVPNGVESIEPRSLNKAEVKAIFLPKSCQVISGGAYSKSFHVKYEIIKSLSPIIGQRFLLVPRVLILDDKTMWNELSSKIDRMRIPEAIKQRMKEIESVKIRSLEPRAYDSFGVQYTNNDKDLDIAPDELKEYTIPEGVERITGLGFYHTDIEDLTIPSTLGELYGIDRHFRSSGVKKLHFKGFKTTCIIDLNKDLEIIEVPKGSMAHYREQFPEYQDKIVEI